MVTYSEQPLPIEPKEIVASRIARALDMAAAPMFWPTQYWSSVKDQISLAESFMQSAERFVLGHEIAHMYVANEAYLASHAEDWRSTPRRIRQQTKELAADAVGLDRLMIHAIKFAEENAIQPEDTALHGMTGTFLTLAAVDLLERYDDRYVAQEYPRAAQRRIHMRRLIEKLPQYSDAVREWEALADHQAADALTIALRRRTAATEAVDDLLAERDGTDWSPTEFTEGMRICLRHCRSGTLGRLARVRASPQVYSDRVKRLVEGFITEFLIARQGEPIYLPFLQEIGWIADA
jgi:hypothetical protein